MIHDGKLTIMTGLSRKETQWKAEVLNWSDLVQRLSRPLRTDETMAEYAAMPIARRSEIKDVGGFVGGRMDGTRRKKDTLTMRSILTLDIDYGDSGVWDIYEMLCDWNCFMHETHSSTPAEPRYRMILPMSREVTADEYEAIGRKVAQIIGIELFDDCTYQSSRLMYWPSIPKDAPYEARLHDGVWLNPDAVLDLYEDWQDCSEWPRSSRCQRELTRRISGVRQQDPWTKKGIVGAFCHTYTVPQAIDKYLSEVYKPGSVPDRYTYIPGTTSNGLVIYDEGRFAYSHHGTDPAFEQLLNAYDLVRVHLYGHLGKEASEKQMVDLFEGNKELGDKLQEISMSTVGFDDADDDTGLAYADNDFTEQGNAVRLKRNKGQMLRFCPALGWCWWDGTVWVRNAEREARLMQMQENDAFKAEAERQWQLAPHDGKGAKKSREQAEAEERLAWAKRSRSTKVIDASIKQGQSLMQVDYDGVFDTNPWELNTPGGIVDLRTGELCEHDSTHMCTMITTVSPSRESAPMWADFLHRVTGGDEEFEKYLQMIAGMCCVGKVYEEGLVISYGPGSNGKSTLFSAWHSVLGDYALTVRNEVLVGTKSGSEVAGRNQLCGKRLVLTGELDEGTTMHSGMLKRLTSRDVINADVKYKEPISFVPSHTLIMHTNYLPKLPSSDYGTQRRIAIAPFMHTIPPEKKIMDFASVLVEREGGAILQWMIDGAVRFYKADMKIEKPPVVVKATEEYLTQEDWCASFVKECCAIEEEAEVQSKDLYEAYCQWARDNGLSARSMVAFAKALQGHGYRKERRMSGAVWIGLRLADDCL